MLTPFLLGQGGPGKRCSHYSPRSLWLSRLLLTPPPSLPLQVGQATWHRPGFGTTGHQLPGFRRAGSCFLLLTLKRKLPVILPERKRGRLFRNCRARRLRAKARTSLGTKERDAVLYGRGGVPEPLGTRSLLERTGSAEYSGFSLADV